jgi:hypothetical protein
MALGQLAGVVGILAVTGGAPVAGAGPEVRPTACALPEHRQLDFWLGDWEVTAKGTIAGRNRIEAILDGCALIERWEGSGGGRGVSLSMYAVADGRWHQTWVDGRGGRLELAGGWDEATATMTLTGRQPVDREGEALHEISWERLADGGVRQRWRVSLDDGRTWRELFDGRYARGSSR